MEFSIVKMIISRMFLLNITSGRQFSTSSTKLAGNNPTWPVLESSPLYHPLSRFFCKITMSPTFSESSKREFAGYFVTQRYRSGEAVALFDVSLVVSRLLDFLCWALSWVFCGAFEVLAAPEKLMLCLFWAVALEFGLKKNEGKAWIGNNFNTRLLSYKFGSAERWRILTRWEPNCKFSLLASVKPSSIGQEPDLMWLYCSEFWLGFVDDAEEAESSNTGLSIE